VYQKDVLELNDRLARVEANAANAVKEKNNYVSQAAAKEKEIAELTKRLSVLKANVQYF
jgi:chromosome segregation ATPase